jgi:YggT family protein
MYALIHSAFLVFTVMLAIRIMGSWIPEFSNHPWMLYIAQFTDPYLNLFRRFIPPIGGMLDLSPMVAFFALQFLESLLKSLFR